MNNIFSILPIQVFMDDRLSKTDLRVLGAIMSWRNIDTNLMWPKRDQIAKRCNLPLCKISTATTHLVELGWLKKEGNGGCSRSTKYQFLVPVLADKKVTDSVTVTESVTVTDSVTKTVTDSVTKTVTDSVRGIKQTNEQTTEQTNKDSKHSDIVNLFDEFYCQYPKKEGRINAEKSWGKISSEIYPLIIADVINRAANHEGWVDKKYIPNPATYLNQKRWLDEIRGNNHEQNSNATRAKPGRKPSLVEQSEAAVDRVLAREARERAEQSRVVSG